VNRDALGYAGTFKVLPIWYLSFTGAITRVFPGEYDILLCHRDRCAERHWAGKLW
jgi:hypothetical protein